MSPVDLKNSLHRMVVETDDPVILAQIAACFSSLLGERDEGGSFLQEEKGNLEQKEAAPKADRTIRFLEIRKKAKDILGSL